MREAVRLLRKRGWLALVVAVLAAAGTYAISASRDDVYRAESKLTVSHGNVDDLAKLLESGIVFDNVAGNLRLEPDYDLAERMDVRTADQSNVIVLTVDDTDSQRAVRVAQEAALVFAQLVRERYAASPPPPPTVVIFDPARALAEPVGPRPARDAALAGILAALLVLFALAARAAGRAPADEPEQAPVTVLEGVAARERALVGRHAEIAARERTLAQRIEAVAARERALVRRAAEFALRERRGPSEEPALAQPEPPPPPLVERPQPAAPVRPAAPPPTPAGVGAFNLGELEHAVDAHAAQHPPEVVEEWRFYLLFLRDHASADGALPSQFDTLVAETFAALVEAV